MVVPILNQTSKILVQNRFTVERLLDGTDLASDPDGSSLAHTSTSRADGGGGIRAVHNRHELRNSASFRPPTRSSPSFPQRMGRRRRSSVDPTYSLRPPQEGEHSLRSSVSTAWSTPLHPSRHATPPRPSGRPEWLGHHPPLFVCGARTAPAGAFGRSRSVAIV